MIKIRNFFIYFLILKAGVKLNSMTLRRIWPIRKTAATARLKKRAISNLIRKKPFIHSTIHPRQMFFPSYNSKRDVSTSSLQPLINTSASQDQLLQQLITAIYNQDITQLRSLSEQGLYVTPEQLKDLKFNPLVTAVLLENKNLVQQLLSMGFDPNFTLPLQDSALAATIGTGDYTIAQMLIQAGANINTHVNKLSLLEHALLLGEMDIARLLRHHGAKESGSQLVNSEIEQQIKSLDQNTLQTKATILYNYIKDLVSKWWHR